MAAEKANPIDMAVAAGNPINGQREHDRHGAARERISLKGGNET